MQDRILLVEDEPALQSLLARYLARLGYEVTSCATRAEATPHAGEPFRAAIIDLSLPDGPGEELAARLQDSRPELRVLLTSGYPAKTSGANTAFLQKPFLPAALAEALTALLRA
ncbi:MAG: response regulator [Bryobacteraceae bacterium]